MNTADRAYTTAFVITLAGAPGVVTPGEAWASWFESLVMPGEVAAKHARVERQCDKCHVRFDKAAQDGLCVACHTDVAADLRAQRGYHGQAPAVRGRTCKTCHSEHLGRGTSIVQLDRKTFDHGLTDAPLRGAHTRVACDDCHAADKRYREAATQCSGCHGRTDPHDGRLGLACDTCHAETAWTAVRFDHATTTFPLEGRHQAVRCEACHTTKRYKPTPSTCVGCHARNDKHRGTLGDRCESCHTPGTWSAARFDHLRRTRFPLESRHARTRCESCHKQTDARGRTPTACDGCHAREDAHQGHFGRTCETCHTPSEWPRHTFEHDRRTRYALRGRHRQARCTACHPGDLSAQRADTSCYACHRHDDVHGGREGIRCDKCHDERSWHSDVLFDHGSTRLPLMGAHTRVACTQCHTSPAFAHVAHECVSCHEGADIHRGREGTRCGDCHNQTTWQLPRAEDSRQRTVDAAANAEAQ
jgi:hypothetical protein